MVGPLLITVVLASGIAQADEACDKPFDGKWVRTLASAAELGWERGQHDAVRISARAFDEQVPCLGERISPHDAGLLHRVLALDLLLSGGGEAAIRHLAAAQRLEPDWELAQRDPGALGQAWKRASVQPAAGQLAVTVPEGAELWVDGLPASSLPSGRPALVQLTVAGELRRTRLTAGEHRALSDGWHVQEERSRLSRTLGEVTVALEVPDAPEVPGAGTSTAPAQSAPASTGLVSGPLTSSKVTVLFAAEGGVAFGASVNRYSRMAAYLEGGAVDRASWDRLENQTLPVASVGLGVRLGEVAELRASFGVFGRQVMEDVAAYDRESCVVDPTSCPNTTSDQTIGTSAYWVDEETPSPIGGLDLQVRVSPFGFGPVRPFLLVGMMPRFYFSDPGDWNWMWQLGAGARVPLGRQLDLSVSVPVSPVQDGMFTPSYKGGEASANDAYVSRNTVESAAFARINMGLDLHFN